MEIFSRSKFSPMDIIKDQAKKNINLLSSGKENYESFLTRFNGLDDINEDQYMSIVDIYSKLNIIPFAPISKRNLYNQYKSGIVIGAGSGDDCIDLVDNKNWKLYDLSDKRMINKAVGYEVNIGHFNHVKGYSNCDTLSTVNPKRNPLSKEISFISIDEAGIKECELISVDAEGSAIDIISGSRDTIGSLRPDLYICIYHNWQEYLMTIPILYDLGYNIKAVYGSNPVAQYPYSELALYCKHQEK